MARMKTSPTVEQLMEAISSLEKKIEKKEKQIIKPFIPLILKADRIGMLGQLQEACKQVVCGTKQPVMPKKMPSAASTEETVIQKAAEPTTTPKNAWKLEFPFYV